jgi:DNA-binding IclR family transcriptional regulator
MLAWHQEVEGELNVDEAQLLKIVRGVADKGYAQIQSRQIRGVTHIAFPPWDSAGQAMAVLKFPTSQRIDKKVTPSIEVKETLTKTAQRLSLLMRYVG